MNWQNLEFSFRQSLQTFFDHTKPLKHFHRWSLQSAVDHDFSKMKNFQMTTFDLVEILEFDIELTWPITALITKSHMNAYNKVFRFVLHIKLVYNRLVDMDFKTALDRLIYDGQLVHILRLLRFRFLNLLQSLLTFIIGQVEETLNIAHLTTGSDFNDLICKKESVVQCLLKRTFLHPSSDIVLRVILKILKSAQLLLEISNQDASFDSSIIMSMFEEVEKSHKFLIYLLQKCPDQNAKWLRCYLPDVRD